MITVVTPFSRIENKDLMINHLQGKCNWIVLLTSDQDIEFPDWVTVKKYDLAEFTNRNYISNRLINRFISDGLDKETQYMVLCDDDFVEEGFWDKIPNEDVVYVGMKRGDYATQHIVWNNWKERLGHFEDGIDILEAKPENLTLARVGGEQFIVKGKVLRNFRYGLNSSGDGDTILKIVEEYPITYAPHAYVLFNYLQDGRYHSFRRKPIVLFVGDFYCAGNRSMGISEWETNLWKSLESTNLANVGQFHMDKYFYHYGQRGDAALIESVNKIKPDYIVLVVYKPLESDPTVLTHETLVELSKYKLITIWGDLEADEQQVLAKQIAPHCWRVIGTANEEIVSGLGYTYMHVPKDPRIFNNPNRKRDIDVLFNGSFGYGREERKETLQYLIDNGIKLVAGGSEGGDHFTTEEYAERFKRSKIAISFSRARGKDVVNARPFEAMLCGALVLTQESKEMEKLYDSTQDCVAWKDKEDLLFKIKFYLEDQYQNMRAQYALNGQKKTEQLYSAKTFWDKVLA